MTNLKSKNTNKKYRIIKEEFVNNYECKITVVTE